MSTAHINAKNGDFAKVVLMPGDPLRAQYIAQNYLHDVVLVNNVRNMFAYTGYTKNNIKVSVMGSGMGMPSIGIYSYELFSFFGVEAIIRIGTCGSYQENINLKDVVIAQTSSTDSNWANQYNLKGTFSAGADYELLSCAVELAKKNNIPVHVGNVITEDAFYHDDQNHWKKWAEMGVLGVEMESYALYCNANRLHKKALAIFSVSNSFLEKEELSAKERETSLNNMIEIALGVAEQFI